MGTTRATIPVTGFLSGVTALAAADDYCCAIIGANGGVRFVMCVFNMLVSAVSPKRGVLCRCWGRNDYGAIGDGTATTRLAPPAADIMTGASIITVGVFHTCVLTTYYSVRCWGYDSVRVLCTHLGVLKRLGPLLRQQHARKEVALPRVSRFGEIALADSLCFTLVAAPVLEHMHSL